MKDADQCPTNTPRLFLHRFNSLARFTLWRIPVVRHHPQRPIERIPPLENPGEGRGDSTTKSGRWVGTYSGARPTQRPHRTITRSERIRANVGFGADVKVHRRLSSPSPPPDMGAASPLHQCTGIQRAEPSIRTAEHLHRLTPFFQRAGAHQNKPMALLASHSYGGGGRQALRSEYS
jgi:hypothetical protein